MVIEGRRLAAGETITIDGGTGEVFEGQVGGVTVVVPEVATLLSWAKELGIEIPGASAEDAAEGPPAAAAAGCQGPARRAVVPRSSRTNRSHGR